MRKYLIILLLVLLTACQPQEELITPPTHQEVGKICTYVATFDDNTYNISIYYTQNETYPIQNEGDLYEVSDIILNYSTSGMKDVSKYEVNQENSLKECGITSEVSVIKTAVQIDSVDFQKFIQDLNDFEFYYEVDKEGKTFDVLMPNEVIIGNSMELNYKKVKSVDFSEEELSKLENLQIEPPFNIHLDEEREIMVSVDVGELIHKDGSQSINQDNILVGVGEGYQIFLTLANQDALSVDYIPIMTVVKINKEDVNENSYIELKENIFTSDLEEYKLYETDEIIVYDFNPYFYNYEKLSDYVIATALDSSLSWKLDEVKLNGIYQEILDQMKPIVQK